MEETYTFSRALHMMRYGGKKMRFIGWDKEMFIYVSENKILDERNQIVQNEFFNELSSYEIMGSWVEVKE